MQGRAERRPVYNEAEGSRKPLGRAGSVGQGRLLMTNNSLTIHRSVIGRIGSGATPLLVKESVNQAKYVGAVLNSSLGRWFQAHGETLPIPELGDGEQLKLVRLADRILSAKAADPDADTGEFEEAIDWLVYDLYGLTNEETAAVSDFFRDGTVTEEDEERALLRAMEEADMDDRVSLTEVREILTAPDDC